MKILMMTNTFTPHVGGVARSVASFTAEYRRLGHRVTVVAPEFEDMPADEVDVVRIPAIQHFNGSDFSVVLPIPGFLTSEVDAFDPDIVHAHHPFLVGATALRMARARQLPLVFTHHTMFERYTHYVPGDSPALKRFVVNLSTNFANLCDQVFAPSESVAGILRERGVTSRIDVVPTGIDLDLIARGSGATFRAVMGIPEDAFVVGHLGRLAPEKNLEYLADVVSRFVKRGKNAIFLVVGEGPSAQGIRDRFESAGLGDRLHMAGVLEGRFLAGAYQAMDVFAFASTSETQGLVIAEAMAAGVPVVALDGPGVREVVSDGRNGRLITDESVDDFQAGLDWVASLRAEKRMELSRNARKTADGLSIRRCAEIALARYESLLRSEPAHDPGSYDAWSQTLRFIEAEWSVLKGVAEAAGDALQGDRREGRAKT